MAQSTVKRRETDSSGRGIYASERLWQVWLAFLADSRISQFRSRIVIVQGPWMVKNGGGAEASAGYHDRGGCIDIRTWNLTRAELDALIWVASQYAIHFWRRDRARGGMDPHAHAICGWDYDLARGAATQWSQLRDRRDGLASNGPDYERRFEPLVLTPPTGTLKGTFMASDDAEKMLKQILAGQDEILADLDSLGTAEGKRAAAERKRDKQAAQKAKENFSRLVRSLGALADQFGAQGNTTAREAVLGVLAEHPDIDGADNPAPQE